MKDYREGDTGRQRGRPRDLNRHVGNRIRQRRMLLGMTQQQLAEGVGITYQQAHKYEKGVNRISAGRLYMIAETLNVEISFFFDGLHHDHDEEPIEPDRALLDFIRNFTSLTNRRHQAVLSQTIRALAESSEEDATAVGQKLERSQSQR